MSEETHVHSFDYKLAETDAVVTYRCECGAEMVVPSTPQQAGTRPGLATPKAVGRKKGLRE